MEFETVGYFVEYSVNGKYVGCINIDEPDREKIGYDGTKRETAKEDIKLDNKKVIKSGTDYVSRMYPLNGRIKK